MNQSDVSPRKKGGTALRNQTDRSRTSNKSADKHQLHQKELKLQNDGLRKKYSGRTEFAPIGYFTLDGQGIVLDVNLMGADMLGQRRRQIIQKPFVQLVLLSSHHLFNSFLALLKKTPTQQTIEIAILNKHVSSYYARLTGMANIDPGNPTTYRIVLMDITKQKRAQDEIIRLNAELEIRVQQRTAELAAANRELEAFCYSLSHDLRAPLRSIDGFSDILLRESKQRLTEQDRQYFQRIRAASQKMATLINGILRLFRVTRDSFHQEDVDLSGISREIAVELREQSPKQHTQFEITPGLWVHGDKHLLEIMLRNLLENAWKFLGNQSSAAKIQFGYMRKDEKPVFYIRDNGPGFDMAHAAKLFNPFHRMHSQEEFPGTGIGLATVKRIVDRHGGKIWVEARPGRGARFYFTMPNMRFPEKPISNGIIA